MSVGNRMIDKIIVEYRRQRMPYRETMAPRLTKARQRDARHRRVRRLFFNAVRSKVRVPIAVIVGLLAGHVAAKLAMEVGRQVSISPSPLYPGLITVDSQGGITVRSRNVVRLGPGIECTDDFSTGNTRCYARENTVLTGPSGAFFQHG